MRQHPTAFVEPGALIGKGSEVLQFAVVRKGVVIGPNTRICSHAYIDEGVQIGAGCKVKNGARVFTGVTLGDNVFVGPNATFTNVQHPRAEFPAEEYEETIVSDGVSIGAGAVILPNVVLGENCVVGAGAVVTKDVRPGATVVGNPAKEIGAEMTGQVGRSPYELTRERFGQKS